VRAIESSPREACPLSLCQWWSFGRLATLFGMSIFEDVVRRQRISRTQICEALAKVLPHLDIEIVKRFDQVSGFVSPAKALDRRAQHVLAQ
jgi:hypothetical protein